MAGKLGCKIVPPHLLSARLWLGDYLTKPALPALLSEVDWSKAVTDTNDMWANDTVSDCTCAAYADIVQTITANSDGEIDPKLSDVLQMYKVIGNGVDNGATLEDANAYMMKVGLAGVKVASVAAVNVQNVDQIKMAIQLFGAVYVAVALPQSAINQFDAKQPWTVLADDGGIAGGHAIAALGFNAQGPLFETWSEIVQATWAWALAYVEQIYVPFIGQWVSGTGKAPSGLDYKTLMLDQQNL